MLFVGGFHHVSVSVGDSLRHCEGAGRGGGGIVKHLQLCLSMPLLVLLFFLLQLLLLLLLSLLASTTTTTTTTSTTTSGSSSSSSINQKLPEQLLKVAKSITFLKLLSVGIYEAVYTCLHTLPKPKDGVLTVRVCLQMSINTSSQGHDTSMSL